VEALHAALGVVAISLAPMEQAIELGVWLAGAVLFNRLLTLVFWDSFVVKTLGRSAPRLIIQLTSVLVFLIAASGVLRFVFDQSIAALWATSGAIGIVVGLALKNLILDTFSGLAIHLERPFKVGDWINCHTRMGEYIGRVEETNWRTTRLWTTGRNIIVIPNSYLTTTLLTNFSMPGTSARFEMDFVLDFSVPTDRAIRVLSAALVSTIGKRGPLADPAPKVRANGITEYGVQYRLRYYLEPIDVSPSKARDSITQAVVQHINQAGLSISYPRQDVFMAKMPWRQKDWSYLKDQVRQLQSLSLFNNLSVDEIEFIAKHMTIHSLDEMAVVVKQGEAGNSMFILAEGLVEVLINQPDGSQIKVADLAPGTFFGEKSLLTGEPRSASIVCVAESTVCEITKSCIASLLDRNPDLAETLGRAVVERDMQNELALSRATKEEVDLQVTSAVGQFISKIWTFFGAKMPASSSDDELKSA
jgi:small-conductance mechanosensitive channel/CRP-like cAMP-binding protein